MLFSKKTKKPAAWTSIGTGINLDKPDKVIELGLLDDDRKGHLWCFGTTRVGKTRIIENIIEQDIRKGYSVVAIDPKGDVELFSKITQVAAETGRLNDLMLISPVFPELSAIIDPLSSYYMPEELVAHITAGVTGGRDPFFYGVAYEISLVIVYALIFLAEHNGETPSFNLNDIKNYIGWKDIKELKEKLEHVDHPEAEQLCKDMDKILATPPDYFSKVANSLRVTLTEMTVGSIGQIIGKANENRFLANLEKNKGVILVVQLGSLLTKRASYTVGKVILSMIQAFVGRVFSSGKKVSPRLVIHIDEAQSVLYQGIDELFAKAGGADVYLHGYCQSVSQLYGTVGKDQANIIMDNCNSKLFMRVTDATTAKYIATHLGDTNKFSPIISVGGGLSIRETEEQRVKHTEILEMKAREIFLSTYSGMYRGRTKTVSDGTLEVVFPDFAMKDYASAN